MHKQKDIVEHLLPEVILSKFELFKLLVCNFFGKILKSSKMSYYSYSYDIFLACNISLGSFYCNLIPDAVFANRTTNLDNYHNEMWSPNEVFFRTDDAGRHDRLAVADDVCCIYYFSQNTVVQQLFIKMCMIMAPLILRQTSILQAFPLLYSQVPTSLTVCIYFELYLLHY